MKEAENPLKNKIRPTEQSDTFKVALNKTTSCLQCTVGVVYFKYAALERKRDKNKLSQTFIIQKITLLFLSTSVQKAQSTRKLNLCT